MQSIRLTYHWLLSPKQLLLSVGSLILCSPSIPAISTPVPIRFSGEGHEPGSSIRSRMHSEREISFSTLPFSAVGSALGVVAPLTDSRCYTKRAVLNAIRNRSYNAAQRRSSNQDFVSREGAEFLKPFSLMPFSRLSWSFISQTLPSWNNPCELFLE